MEIHSRVLFLPQALEYLLWASTCMEFSVPLLSVRYLTWRATLYTAVCQGYYDCQAGIHGEVGRLPRSGFQYLKIQVIQHFLLQMPGNTNTNRQTKPKESHWDNTQVPGFICRNVFGFSILLISRSTFCSLLSSPFTSASSAPFLNKISGILPSSLDACMQVTFLPVSLQSICLAFLCFQLPFV